MKSVPATLWAILSSRATSPIVLAIFLMVYIVLAFGTEDALIALMAVTSSSLLLKLLLAILPLSAGSRLYLEVSRHLKRRKLLQGEAPAGEVPEALFDEAASASGSQSLERLESFASSEGYATRRTETTLSAWRGGGGSAARVVFLAATSLLFAGILISVSTRSMHRAVVIEGQPMPTATGGGGTVEKITLAPSHGKILAQDLVMQVAASSQGDPAKEFSLYPPSLYRGHFVYPRYLGIAPQVSITAPDLPEPYLAFHVVNIYPVGKEDKADLAGSPYRMMLSLAEAGDRSDPFATGHATVMFKLLRGESVVLSGSAPLGGEFVQGGYRIAFPEFRRTVQTDFVLDYGVPLIWSSGLLFILAACVFLPSRLLFPRREMLFVRRDDGIRGFSRAEGGRRRHVGVFHEVLDLVESRAADPAPAGAGRPEMAGV